LIEIWIAAAGVLAAAEALQGEIGPATAIRKPKTSGRPHRDVHKHRKPVLRCPPNALAKLQGNHIKALRGAQRNQ
jgi:hypothetical protein